MASLNKIQIIGHIGRDPETRMAGETKVSNFSVAVTEKYKGRDGQTQEKTEWIKVVFWGRQAEICEQYLKKGSSVYVEGKLETRSWDDKTTGEKKYQTEVRGTVLQMLGGAKKEDTYNTYDNRGTDFSAAPAPEDDTLPF